MTKPARRLSVVSAFVAAATLVAAVIAPGAEARAQSLYNQPKYAAIVVDAATGEVLYARRADQPRYPASVTKIMTFYLVFEALATGRLSLQDKIVLSSHAAAEPPSKSGLRAGESISVDQALRLTAVHSANDLAVALAEKIGGTESRFAALMTLRAQELGMTSTRFVNANGLPDPRQITTARDLAILSRAVMRDYPQYYSYFSEKTFDFNGRHFASTNHLLSKMPGVDGIKTGYTNPAGFNLAASGVRDGHRLIAVVLGGQSTAARDENVEDLLNAGFEVFSKRKAGQAITIAANMREPDDVSGPVTRPATEQGSAEQAGLQVAVVDNPLLRGVQSADPASGPTAAWLNTAGSATGLKATAIALSNSSREGVATPDCAKVVEKVKVKARRHHKAHTETRTKTVCKTAVQDKPQVAKADTAPDAKAGAAKTAALDCDKLSAKGTSRRARAAARKAQASCQTQAKQQLAANTKAPPSAAKAGLKGKEVGDYRIQVGAFDSKGAATAYMTKIVQRYGAVVAQASAQVEPGPNKHSAYRARFNGYSQEGAKAACAALTAKGERCLVLAPG